MVKVLFRGRWMTFVFMINALNSVEVKQLYEAI